MSSDWRDPSLEDRTLDIAAAFIRTTIALNIMSMKAAKDGYGSMPETEFSRSLHALKMAADVIHDCGVNSTHE